MVWKQHSWPAWRALGLSFPCRQLPRAEYTQAREAQMLQVNCHVQLLIAHPSIASNGLIFVPQHGKSSAPGKVGSAIFNQRRTHTSPMLFRISQGCCACSQEAERRSYERFAGTLVGPAALGAVADRASVGAALACNAALLAAVAVLFWLTARDRGPDGRPPAARGER